MATNECKAVFERSSFADTKSRHLKYIDEHHLNHAVEIILPSSDSMPEAVLESCPVSDRFFLVKGLPVLELVKGSFVNKILKRGHFTALSVGTRVDSNNVVAILPTGHLILLVDKDTYQELGLQGRPSAFTGRNATHFVIDVDLFSTDHRSGSKQYERVIWSLKGRLCLDLNYIFTWEPNDGEESAISQLARVLDDRYTIEELPLKSTTRNSGRTLIPELDSQQTLSKESAMEAHSRIGRLSYVPNHSSNDQSESSVSHVENVVSACWTGMITANRIHQMLSATRSLLKSSGSIPWAVLTVHGFDDSPVSWGSKEHGFGMNGCNLYSFVVFPNDDYWHYMGVGENDVCP